MESRLPRRSAICNGPLCFSHSWLLGVFSRSVFDSVCTIFALCIKDFVAFGLTHPLCCCSSDTRTPAAPLAGQINAARDRELNKERAHLCYFWPPQSKYYCSAHRHNCHHFCERKHWRCCMACGARVYAPWYVYAASLDTYSSARMKRSSPKWVRKNNRQKLVVLFHSAVEISAIIKVRTGCENWRSFYGRVSARVQNIISGQMFLTLVLWILFCSSYC
jgi:hypothetical protein